MVAEISCDLERLLLQQGISRGKLSLVEYLSEV